MHYEIMNLVLISSLFFVEEVGEGGGVVVAWLWCYVVSI
jgi:hypothetical protein